MDGGFAQTGSSCIKWYQLINLEMAFSGVEEMQTSKLSDALVK
ncbi:hypothetical protein EVAR_72311_1, partial [Eumeta japonica]